MHQIVLAKRAGGNRQLCAVAFGTVCNGVAFAFCTLGVFKRNIAAAALVAVGVYHRLRPQRPDKILQDGGIFRVVKGHDRAGAQEKTAVVRAYLPPSQGLYDLFLHLVEADAVAQHLQEVQNPGLPPVRLV